MQTKLKKQEIREIALELQKILRDVTEVLTPVAAQGSRPNRKQGAKKPIGKIS
jgi:hypothetical protein